MVTTDIPSLKNIQSGEFIVETGLSYNGLVPVCVRITKREGRFEFPTTAARSRPQASTGSS